MGTYRTAIAIASTHAQLEAWRALCAAGASLSDLHGAACEAFALEQVHETCMQPNPTSEDPDAVRWIRGESEAWTRVRRELETDPALHALFGPASVKVDQLPPDEQRAAASMQRHARTMLRMLGRAFRERMQRGEAFAHELGGGRFVIAFPDAQREAAFAHAASVRPVPADSVAAAIEASVIRRRELGAG